MLTIQKASMRIGLLLFALANASCRHPAGSEPSPSEIAPAPSVSSSAFAQAPDPSESEEPEPDEPSRARPAKALGPCEPDECELRRFVDVFNRGDVAALSRFVEPKWGVLALSNPGVMTKGYWYPTLKDAFEHWRILGAQLDPPVIDKLVDYSECAVVDNYGSPEADRTIIVKSNGKIGLRKWPFGGSIEYEDAKARRMSQAQGHRILYYMYQPGNEIAFFFVRAPRGKGLRLVAVSNVTECSA